MAKRSVKQQQLQLYQIRVQVVQSCNGAGVRTNNIQNPNILTLKCEPHELGVAGLFEDQ